MRSKTHLTEITQEKLEQIQYKLAGQLKPKKGHIVFEVNTISGSIQKAEFMTNLTYVVSSNGYRKSTKNQQIMMKKDCIYISALNVENVKKKLKKLADGKV